MSYPPYRSFRNKVEPRGKPPSALTGGYVTPHGEDQLRRSSPSLQESMTSSFKDDIESGNFQVLKSNSTEDFGIGAHDGLMGESYQPIDEDFVAPGEPGYKYDNHIGPWGMNSGRNSWSGGGVAGIMSHPATPAALLTGGGIAAIYGLSKLWKGISGAAGGGLREDYIRAGFDPDNPPVPLGQEKGPDPQGNSSSWRHPDGYRTKRLYE